MNDIETLTQRIDALEASRTHQDRTIDDLSEAVAAQWKLIETLNRQVARLTEQLHEVRASTGPVVTEEPPPHY
jgi:SlyX protein